MINLPTSNKKWINSLIFLRIPKNASTSVMSALGERNLLWKHRGLLAQHLQNSPIYRGLFDTTHAKPPDLFQIFGHQVCDFFSFAIVRKPYERLKSMWGFGRREKLGYLFGWPKDLAFEKFVDRLYEEYQRGNRNIIALHNQTEWTHSESFTPTIILRMETLQKDWAAMKKEFDISWLPDTLPHDNKSTHNVSIDPQRKLKVKEMFARDFELLNY